MTNLHAPPALGSPTPSTDEKVVHIGYDVKVTPISPCIDESALIRKIDLQVIPALCLLFVFAFLDRVNIANAAVYGMSKDLGLVGNQYNAALTIL